MISELHSKSITKVILALIWIVLNSTNSIAQDKKVYLVEIEGVIDNGIASYVKRGIEIAEKDSTTKLVLFRIDTFGGLVDAADEIRKSILDCKITTAAYIDKNAASAGALIALACDSIIVANGASIGAATVVQGTGEKASEKMQSYMRSLMRSTAEVNNRNPKIAEAMVDESIAVEGISDAGKLLSLSAHEAVKFGIADYEANSLESALDYLGFAQANIEQISERWEESILRLLANPVVSSILMLMMLGGLYYELQSPGVGFPGIISVIGAMLFFAPLYIMGLAQSWEIILFVVGVILLIIEIFIIPGLGLAGISGITLIIFSLGAALIGNIGLSFPALSQIGGAVWTLSITIIIGMALISSLARYLPENPFFRTLVLEGALKNENEFHELDELTGQEGITVTPLRPSGVVMINQKKYTVVSDGEFIMSETSVKVVSSMGNRIVVTKS